jgi:hypothetical protein
VAVGLGPRAIDLERSAYRASHIALYSTFLGPPPPMNTVTLRETIQ